VAKKRKILWHLEMTLLSPLVLRTGQPGQASVICNVTQLSGYFHPQQVRQRSLISNHQFTRTGTERVIFSSITHDTQFDIEGSIIAG
jgi:hypothetical protein